MQIFVYFSIIFISFYIHFYDKGPDYHWSKWVLTLLLGIFVVFWKLKDKYHWSLWLAFWYIALSAVYTFGYFDNQHIGMNPQVVIILAFYSAVGLISFMCIFSVSSLLAHYKSDTVKNLFAFICVCDCILVLIQWAIGREEIDRGGMFGNASINASFIAFTFPLVVFWAKGFITKYKHLIGALLYFIVILAIYASMASIPVGVFALSVSVLVFLSIPNKWLKVLALLGMFIGILGVAYILFPKGNQFQLFDDSLRFGMYDHYLKSFFSGGNIWLGYGLSTFPYFGIESQLQHQYMVGSWAIWAHSDWLQTFMELGVIGTTCMVIPLIVVLRRSLSDKYLCASIFGYMGCMCWNYPLHYPVHAIFGLWLVLHLLKKAGKDPHFEHIAIQVQSRKD